MFAGEPSTSSHKFTYYITKSDKKIFIFRNLIKLLKKNHNNVQFYNTDGIERYLN